MKKMNKRDLELVQALRVIGDYKAKHGANFDKDILSLIDTLLQITEKEHYCQNCGEKLIFYAIKGEGGRFFTTVMNEK